MQVPTLPYATPTDVRESCVSLIIRNRELDPSWTRELLDEIERFPQGKRLQGSLAQASELDLRNHLQRARKSSPEKMLELLAGLDLDLLQKTITLIEDGLPVLAMDLREPHPKRSQNDCADLIRQAHVGCSETLLPDPADAGPLQLCLEYLVRVGTVQRRRLINRRPATNLQTVLGVVHSVEPPRGPYRIKLEKTAGRSSANAEATDTERPDTTILAATGVADNQTLAINGKEPIAEVVEATTSEVKIVHPLVDDVPNTGITSLVPLPFLDVTVRPEMVGEGVSELAESEATSPDTLLERLSDTVAALRNVPAPKLDWDRLRRPIISLERLRTERTAEIADEDRRSRLAKVRATLETLVGDYGERFATWDIVDAVPITQWSTTAVTLNDIPTVLASLSKVRQAVLTVISCEEAVPTTLKDRKALRKKSDDAEEWLAEKFKETAVLLDPRRPVEAEAVPGSRNGPEVLEVDLQGYIDLRITNEQFASLYEKLLFADAIRDFSSQTSRWPGLSDVTNALAERMNFDFTTALSSVWRSLPPERTIVAWVEQVRASQRAELIQLTDDLSGWERIAELYWHAEIAQRRGNLIDFVGRIGGLTEQVLVFALGKHHNQRFASIDELRGFTTRGAQKVVRRTANAEGAVAELIRAAKNAFVHGTKDQQRLLAFATKLDLVKKLRNESCIAHGLEPVTNAMIDTALETRVVGKPGVSPPDPLAHHIDEVPRNLWGSEWVLWVAKEVVCAAGSIPASSFPAKNPLDAAGEKIAGHIRAAH